MASYNTSNLTPSPIVQTATIDLSVVIPALNEERKIGRAIQHVLEYAKKRHLTAEVIVVNDGSTDQTAAIVTALSREFSDPNAGFSLQLLTHSVRRGKGFSIREGMLLARGRVAVFSDADMSTPMTELDKFERYFEEGFDVVIGSRILPDAVLDPPQAFLRKTLGGAFRLLRRMLILPEIRDSQCGFKAFTHHVAQDIFSRQRTGGPAFDCEILLLAKHAGYRIKEVGILWQNDPDSRIHIFRDGFHMLVSLFRIWRQFNGKR